MPAIALGMENMEPHIMEQKPKPKNEGVFARGLGVRVVLQGIMFALLTLTGFVIGEQITGNVSGGQTMAFLILSFSQVVQAFNMDSKRSLFKIGIFSNKSLNKAAIVSTILIVLVLFTQATIAFGLVSLPITAYFIGFRLSFVPLPVMELSKLFWYKNNI